MAFAIILDLFAGIQSIKRKYPIVVAYYKYLQKISGDSDLEENESNHFKNWLAKNPNVIDKKMTDPFYHGSKKSTVICFLNVILTGTEETIDWFWKRLQKLETIFFPNGRKEEEISKETTETPTGAAAAISVLESNPIFSDMIDNVKSIVADLDPTDAGSILESKEFNKLVKNFQTGLKSGKYKISDLTGPINAVIGSVQNELDPEMKNIVNSATSMISAAERGEEPNVGKLLDMMKNVNFNK